MIVFVRRSRIRGRSRSGGPPRSACFAVVALRAAPIVLVLLVSLVAALALAALALVLVVLARASPMAARAVASRVMAAPHVCVPRRSLCSALVALRDELVAARAAHVVFSIVPASAVR